MTGPEACVIAWRIAGASVALAAIVALGPAVDALSPDIHPVGPEVPPRHSQPRITAPGAPGTPAVDKTRLIIEQNPECWIGQPGATCNPNRRTYA